jgi:hypothetical protein
MAAYILLLNLIVKVTLRKRDGVIMLLPTVAPQVKRIPRLIDNE